MIEKTAKPAAMSSDKLERVPAVSNPFPEVMAGLVPAIHVLLAGAP